MLARNLFGAPVSSGSGTSPSAGSADEKFHQIGGYNPGTRGKDKPINWLPTYSVDEIGSPILVFSPQQKNGRTCGPCCLLRLRNQMSFANSVGSPDLPGSSHPVIQPGSPDWERCVRLDDGLKDRDDMKRVARSLDLGEADYCLKEACSSNEMLICLSAFIEANGPSVVGVNAPRIGGHYIVVLRLDGTKVWFFDPYHGVEARWEFYGANGFYNALVGSSRDDSVQMIAYRMRNAE